MQRPHGRQSDPLRFKSLDFEISQVSAIWWLGATWPPALSADTFVPPIDHSARCSCGFFRVPGIGRVRSVPAGK